MTTVQLTAPGVYPVPPVPAAASTQVRLDVTGFVGIAPRGPVNQAIPVRGWDEYLARFGGYGPATGSRCPGLLADAVAAYFRQGGELAWVVRVAPWPDPAYPDPATLPPDPDPRRPGPPIAHRHPSAVTGTGAPRHVASAASTIESTSPR